MKLIIVANYAKPTYPKELLELEMKAQIDNSLLIGWKADDIWPITNFEFEFMGVKAKVFNELPPYCLTGSKTFAVDLLFKHNMVTETLFVHDLDVWQNHFFHAPEFVDIAYATYSKPKLNGGVVFVNPTDNAKRYFNDLANRLHKSKDKQEEPSINAMFAEQEYAGMFTVLNYSYNIGCSGFIERYLGSEMPIKCAHFHPSNRIAWDTHICDRNNLGYDKTTVTDRTLAVIMKWFFPDKSNQPKPRKRPGEVNPNKPIRWVSHTNPDASILGPATSDSEIRHNHPDMPINKGK